MWPEARATKVKKLPTRKINLWIKYVGMKILCLQKPMCPVVIGMFEAYDTTILYTFYNISYVFPNVTYPSKS